MKSDLLTLAIGLVSGVAAGAVFFGGLYLVTQWIPRVRRPVLLMTLSFVGRIAAVLIAAWGVGTILGAWSLLAYLVGITLARIVLVRIVRPEDADAGGDHAPAARPGEGV